MGSPSRPGRIKSVWSPLLGCLVASFKVCAAHLLRFPMGRINLVTKVQQGSCPGGDGALPLLLFPLISPPHRRHLRGLSSLLPWAPLCPPTPRAPAWHLCVELALCTVHGAA